MLSSCSSITIFKGIVISSVLISYLFQLVFLTLQVENNTIRRKKEKEEKKEMLKCQ